MDQPQAFNPSGFPISQFESFKTSNREQVQVQRGECAEKRDAQMKLVSLNL